MTVEPVQSFWRRVAMPVTVLLIIWLLANIALLLLAGRPELFGDPAVYRAVTNFLFALQFLILLLGALFIYPIMFFRGASLAERIAGSLVVPLAQMVWAMIRATEFFPAGEAIYYGFNSVAIGSVFLQFAWIGLAEIICRWRYRRKTGAQVTVIRWPYLVSVVVGFLAIYLTLFWDGGVHWFYLYQEGYKALFQ
jgi:hypothetical protein